MYPFQYQRADSLKNAMAALASDPDAKVLAGGMSLIPSMKLRLSPISRLIDLAAIPGIDQISVQATEVEIGAMTRHYKVASSDELARALPVLKSLAGGIGDVQVRHRGTIGGSIANADPAADYPASVLGLGATIVTTQRTIPGDNFFKGLFETALRPDEIVQAIRYPIPQAAVYLKFANLASRFAIVGVFLAKFKDSVRVSVTGAAPCVFRVKEFESALTKSFDSKAIADVTFRTKDFIRDVHSTPEHRAHLVRVLTERAVTACRQMDA